MYLGFMFNVVTFTLDEEGTTPQNKQTQEYNSLQKEIKETVMLRKHMASCKLHHVEQWF